MVMKNNYTTTEPVEQSSLFCSYYIGAVERSKVWVLVSALRGTEHICFDRTFNVENSIFEFFVPHATEDVFLQVMNYLQKDAVLLSLEKKENRLISSDF